MPAESPVRGTGGYPRAVIIPDSTAVLAAASGSVTCATDDPPSSPPDKPLPSDCCDSGCTVCVFDGYAEKLQRYPAELAAWQLRHGQAPDRAGGALQHADDGFGRQP